MTVWIKISRERQLMDCPKPAGLKDREILQFVVDGYHLLERAVPDELNKTILAKANSLHLDDSRNPGNNIFPLIPELQEVWNLEAVKGVLQSLLGPAYFVHPHRYCHQSQPGFQGRDFETKPNVGRTALTPR